MKNARAHHSGIIERTCFFLMVATALHATGSVVGAGELGHFNPGLANIRDFVVPEPGFYAMLYNYYYTSNRLNDRDGNRIHSMTIDTPGRKADRTLKADVDLDLYALVPMFLWVSPWKLAGARYAAYIAPSFATSSLGASFATAQGRGVNGDLDSSFGMGDLFVQPLWLGWNLKHWDLALGYGFYAPVGRYNVEKVTFPIIGSQKVEADDNIGLGFWTHQIQGATAWYPLENRGTALALAMTYELNQEKEDFDITPGAHLTLNWGISQYLPLGRNRDMVIEIGPAGYSQWKVTDDTGSDARNGDVHDQVHAAGGQLGLTYVPWNAVLTFHYLYEYASEARFQGQVLSLSLAVKF